MTEFPPESACVLRLSAIGDCCHTVPLIRTLQHAWPNTEITWVIGKIERQLMEGIDGVTFITCDKALSHRAALDVRRKLARRRFDILLNIHASMRANLVSLGIRARRRLGFDKARARDGQWLFTNERVSAAREHVMDGMLRFGLHLGIAEPQIRWDIPIPKSAQEFAGGLNSDGVPTCIISPCSSQRKGNFRNWSIKNYVAVAESLHSRYGAHIVLTGSSSSIERFYAAQIAAATTFPVTNMVGKTSLKQLLAAIGRADLLICPDSGPAHLATAVGTPVVGLYAASNPDRTGPYLSRHLVVNEYPRALYREYGKSVDELRWGTRIRDPEAMSLIQVDRVLEKAALVLGGRNADSAQATSFQDSKASF
jgi:heptosyltransferase I